MFEDEKEMKKVKYEITGYYGYGLVPEGEVVDALLLAQERGSNRAIIYHPKDKNGCASVDVCILDRRTKVWKIINEDAWVNLIGKEDIFKQYLPKQKKTNATKTKSRKRAANRRS